MDLHLLKALTSFYAAIVPMITESGDGFLCHLSIIAKLLHVSGAEIVQGKYCGDTITHVTFAHLQLWVVYSE